MLWKMALNVPRVALSNRFIFFLFGCLTWSVASSGEQQILQGIQITEKNDTAVIQINLGIPVRYIKHFPPQAGEILQIQLDVIDSKLEEEIKKDGKKSLKSFNIHESLIPPANDLVPLVHVTYEGDVPGGPYLTLRFKYAVAYKVEEGVGTDKFHSIMVIVKRDTDKLVVRGSESDKTTLISDQKLDELMAEVKQTLAKEDYARAIQLLNKILKFPDNKYSREAKELLGLAREKKGQIARAKLEYQEYLRLYPKGEGAERVKQRLAAIDAIQAQPRAKLKSVKTANRDFQFDTFGRFSQRFYRENYDSSFDRATLMSMLNVTSRMRTTNNDVRAYFNANDIRDFFDSDVNETRIYSMYVEAKNNKSGLFGSVGRQSISKGGIFGRFDGLWAGYQANEKLAFNVTAGKPVDLSSYGIKANKYFYGSSFEFGPFLKYWDANGYIIDQRVNGIVDRRALGGDLRFSTNKFSLFGATDYDISYNILNIFTVRAGAQITPAARVNINYSFRRSPLILTTNAVQQEVLNGTYASFQDLLDNSTESAIRDKVKGLSSIARFFTLGMTYQFTKNMQFNGDFSRSSVSSRSSIPKLIPVNPSDPNDVLNFIYASEKYGPDYFYSAQIISSNYFVERDVNIFGIRYSNSESRDTKSFFIRSRFPYSEKWRIGPRFGVDSTKYKTDSFVDKITKYTVSANIDYRLFKKVSLESEFGYETSKYSGSTLNTQYKRLYMVLGYYVDF